MVEEVLKKQLEDALIKWDTEEVLKLYLQGASLDEYTIIGIANINGDWSSHVIRSVKLFIKNNPGSYALPIDIKHLDNQSFIKKFSGFISPGAGDSFPSSRVFKLIDLESKGMLPTEILYQKIIGISSKYYIPYLGICSGSQHLVLKNNGSINANQYRGSDDNEVSKAQFLYGTIPYFMTLSEEEQIQALDNCIFPEVIVSPIYLAHSYSAVEEQLGEVTLGAISNRGIVMANSKGTNQIGVQFHPENQYFRSEKGINRQKEFLDNFFKLCKKYNKLINIALEKNVSDEELFKRIEMYDLSLITRLQECTKKAICTNQQMDDPFQLDYRTCSVPNLTKEYFYLQMLDDLY